MALASAADVSFSWACFALAMGSNFFFSLRGIVSKKAMAAPNRPSKHMGPGNTFAVMTALAFL